MSLTRQRSEMVRGKTIKTDMFAKADASNVIANQSSDLLYRSNTFPHTMLPSETEFFDKNVDTNLLVTYCFSPYTNAPDGYVLRRYDFTVSVGVTVDGSVWKWSTPQNVSYSDYGSQTKTYFDEHCLFTQTEIRNANKVRINVKVTPRMGDSGADYTKSVGDDYIRTAYMPYIDDFATPSLYPAGHPLTNKGYNDEMVFTLSCTITEIYDLL